MNLAQHMLVFILRLYRRLVSPLLTAAFGPMGLGCRFTPTCSEFAVEAVRAHGALKGSWLAACRLGRCHPWGGQGLDPVPRAPSRNSGSSVISNRQPDPGRRFNPVSAGGKAGAASPSLPPVCGEGTARATPHLVSRSNGS